MAKTKENFLYLPIWKIFSETPGPRYRCEGNFSGEEFREEILVPLIRQAQQENKKILVDLDGTTGYATVFLDEVFGGVVREFGSNVIELFGFKSDEEEYLIDDIKEYMERAKK